MITAVMKLFAKKCVTFSLLCPLEQYQFALFEKLTLISVLTLDSDHSETYSLFWQQVEVPGGAAVTT